MFIEAFKIVGSLWPLAKEVFLWRDGAEVGKPITQQNLIRRKIAAFVLAGSVLLNYFLVSQFISEYKEAQRAKDQVLEISRQNEVLRKQNDALNAENKQCMTRQEVDVVIAQSKTVFDKYCLMPETPKRKKDSQHGYSDKHHSK